MMSSSCSDSEYIQDDFVESDTINEEDNVRNRDSPDLFEAEFDCSLHRIIITDPEIRTKWRTEIKD